VAGDYLYWTSRENGTVMRRRLAGGTPETLVTGAVSPEGIAADETYVYWGTLGTKSGDGTIWRATLPVAPAAAGVPEQLHRSSSPRQILITGNWLTVTDWGGSLVQINRVTGLRRTRAVGQQIASALAADEKYIYWTNVVEDRKGSVSRMVADRCSVTECALQNKGCSPSTGQCISTCPALPSNSKDFFVDIKAIAAGNGTQACPFRTIKAALAAANASTATSGKTLRVAAGTYSQATGEVFPIELRGISLLGAGGLSVAATARTVIEGEGSVNHASAGGAFPGTYMATLVVGDAANPARIASLVVQPPATVTGGYGVFCDRGTPTATPPGGTRPAANTTADDLVVGPTYDVGVLATNSTSPAASGCNLGITRSLVTSNLTGLYAMGCTVAGSAAPRVAVTIGSQTNATYGNTFSHHHSFPSYAGFGVRVGDCTETALVNRNTFDGNDVGLHLRQSASGSTASFTPTLFEVQSNTLTNQFKAGVQLSRAAIVNAFVGNVISGTSYTGGGVGLLMDSETSPVPYSPRVKRARSNTFLGNDNGIKIVGANALKADANLPSNDFGNAVEPGNNVFRCNSTFADATTPGFDVLITAPASGAASLPFAGNAWDRLTPWSSAGSSAPNGRDVLVTASPAPPVDLSASRVATQACPDGRVAGGLIDNVDAGFTTAGPEWTASTALTKKFGANVVTAAAGSGSSASWTFAGLRPGKYQVAATWPSRSDLANAAPATILDNTKVLATLAVNQKVAPQGASPGGFSERGTSWQYLGGVVTITSTTLVVRLDTTAAGGLVAADAVRLEPVP
jgi:hypothetical protein